MIEIKIRCKGSHELALSELKIMQETENQFSLKELSKENFNKLKSRLETKGFWFPLKMFI